MSDRYDVAVLGLGAVGAATAWRAAARGATVLGVEQFTPGHARGSSHGGSRIYRQTLFEGREYVPLARRALELWTDLETETGTPLFRRTGGLCIGPEDGPLVHDAVHCAREGDVQVELLDDGELGARFPQHALLPGDVGVLEPGAGVLDPEVCVRGMISQAEASGARLMLETFVDHLEYDDAGVRVHIGDTVHQARRAVLATGCWFTDLVPELDLPLRVQRSPLVWFRGADRVAYGPDVFPTFIRESGELDGWGIPDVDGRGVKVGAGPSAPKPFLDHASENTRPIGPEDTAPAERFVAGAFPGLEPREVDALPCMNSKSPDGDFVIGSPAAAPSLVLAGGFSGHGFKHAAAVGELCADLVLEGGSPLMADRFSPDRFATAGAGR
jgi:sarcosine oxidase